MHAKLDLLEMVKTAQISMNVKGAMNVMPMRPAVILWVVMIAHVTVVTLEMEETALVRPLFPYIDITFI